MCLLPLTGPEAHRFIPLQVPPARAGFGFSRALEAPAGWE